MRQLPIAKFAPNISIRNGSSNGMFGKFILANIDTNIMERNFHANRGWLDTYEIKKKKEKKIFPKTKRPTERRPPDYPNQDDQIEEK